MKNLPEKIYLQIDQDGMNWEDSDYDKDFGEVTHCSERINDSDVGYVRADLAELKLLHKIKKEILDKSELTVLLRDKTGVGQINRIEIKSDDWHEIFKTEEYKKLRS